MTESAGPAEDDQGNREQRMQAAAGHWPSRSPGHLDEPSRARVENLASQLDGITQLVDGPLAQLDEMARTVSHRFAAQAEPSRALGERFAAQLDEMARTVSHRFAAQIEPSRALGERFAAQLDEMGRTAGDRFAARLDLTQRMLPNYDRLLDRIVESLSKFEVRTPPNWDDVGLDDLGEDRDPFKEFLDLARSGWPVTWVPSAPVLVDLANSAPTERADVLVSYRDQILLDCTSVLSALTTGQHRTRAAILVQAIEAASTGLYAPAQALAANVLDTMIRESVSSWLGYNAFLKRHPTDDYRLSQLRFIATMAPVHQALEQFRTHKGDPVPALYNRHASSHAVGDIQYTQTNSLVGLMLAVSICREFFEQETERKLD